MSTRLTEKGTPMVESRALQLVQGAGAVMDRITRHVSDELQARGYRGATPSVLGFLSTLECGINHGSDIARNLGVSRQMVAKTVRELCRAGYLEQVSAGGRQKQILFTLTGEQLMADARHVLAELDQRFAEQLGMGTVVATVRTLTRIEQVLQEEPGPAP